MKDETMNVNENNVLSCRNIEARISPINGYGERIVSDSFMVSEMMRREISFSG